jgi:crotonobetainyl-CoA:carnitine CoA-transferase CaiB-like acyl-CoA transferase
MTGAPPLAGIRIVEAATYLAGPWATMMLADLGAEVIKVEPPSGDPMRRFGRPSTVVAPVWASCNRGKQTVVLDLKSDEGRAALLDLLGDADVFLANWRPDVAERLGLEDSRLAEANPRLIRCWVTGSGPTGPHADEAAYDIVVQARSGMTDAVKTNEAPVLTPGFPVDKLTGLMTAQAMLAALFARERTGLGDRIDVAMLDAAAYVNFPDLFVNRVFVDHQPEEARSAHVTAQQAFPASDGAFALGAVNGGQVKRTCIAVGHPEWVSDLLGQPDNVALVRRMLELLPPVTRKQPLAQWLETFRAHDVPAASCLTIDEHLADPQVTHNELYQLEHWPVVGQTRTVRYPAVSARWGSLRGRGAPTVEL